MTVLGGQNEQTSSQLLQRILEGELGVNAVQLGNAQSQVKKLEYRLSNLIIDGTDNDPSSHLSRVFEITTDQTLSIVRSIETFLSSAVSVSRKKRGDLYRFTAGNIVPEGALDYVGTICGDTAQILGRPSSVQTTFSTIADAAQKLQSWNDQVPDQVLEVLQSELFDQSSEYRVDSSDYISQQLVRLQLLRINNVRQSVEKTRDDVEDSAGVVGQGSLAEAFEARRISEKNDADKWSRYVIIFVLAATLLPIGFIVGETILNGPLGTVGMLLRVLLAAPFIGLATWSGHIASQHRDTERYLGLLSSQVKSVSAYSAKITDPNAEQELLMILGKRAFADPALPTHDKGKIAAVSVDLIIPLMEKALDAAKGTVTKTPD